MAAPNGISALDIALEALGIGPGDEVILPSFTTISRLGHICRSGATPVPVDADALTWTITAEEVAADLNERNKAVIAVQSALNESSGATNRGPSYRLSKGKTAWKIREAHGTKKLGSDNLAWEVVQEHRIRKANQLFRAQGA